MTVNRFAGMGSHQSARSRTDTWFTPPAIIEALGGADSFDLDPCSHVDRPWPTAREHYPDSTEIICGKHWRMADKKARQFKTKADRAYERARARCEAISAEGDECARQNGGVHTGIIDRFRAAADVRDKASRRCKRQIIERAMGVA